MNSAAAARATGHENTELMVIYQVAATRVVRWLGGGLGRSGGPRPPPHGGNERRAQCPHEQPQHHNHTMQAACSASSSSSTSSPTLPPGAIDLRAVLETKLQRDRDEVDRLQASLNDEHRASIRSREMYHKSITPTLQYFVAVSFVVLNNTLSSGTYPPSHARTLLRNLRSMGIPRTKEEQHLALVNLNRNPAVGWPRRCRLPSNRNTSFQL